MDGQDVVRKTDIFHKFYWSGPKVLTCFFYEFPQEYRQKKTWTRLFPGHGSVMLQCIIMSSCRSWQGAENILVCFFLETFFPPTSQPLYFAPTATCLTAPLIAWLEEKNEFNGLKGRNLWVWDRADSEPGPISWVKYLYIGLDGKLYPGTVWNSVSSTWLPDLAPRSPLDSSGILSWSQMRRICKQNKL